MKEKNISGRLILKHDIETNWLNAISFIPKQGEIIIYDIDDNYEYERFKIGDGKNTVSDLPFASATQISEEEINEICSYDNFTFTENGDVIIEELFENSVVNYDEDGNVFITSEESSSVSYDDDGNVIIS